MNTLCLHRPASPGDLWPPVCVEHAGHKGDHQSKPEFTSPGCLRLLVGPSATGRAFRTSDDIIRPNGKRYRPRLAPSVTLLDDLDGWPSFIVVFRTHDMVRAHELAQPYLDDYAPRGDLLPELKWMREIPCSSDHCAVDFRWIDDPVRGIPCVVWEW